MKVALISSFAIAVLTTKVTAETRAAKMNAAVNILLNTKSEKEALFLFQDLFSSDELNDILDAVEREKMYDNSRDKDYIDWMMDKGYVDKDGELLFADRHIRDFLNVVEDPECMEWEYDLTDPNYSVQDARKTLAKCRMLVVRNLFDPDFMEEYKDRVSDFLVGLHTGQVNHTGHTTNPSYGGGFMEERQTGRWEILLPRHLADPDFLLDDNVLELLADDDNFILGPHMIIDGLGVVSADPGTGYQEWHHDDEYLFGEEEAFRTLNGVAGHDLPPTQILMFTPLGNVTRDMGPTEMCVGSSYLGGMHLFPPVKDPALTDRNSLYYKFAESDGCPENMMRSPLLNMNDAIFWDNQIWHRGGSNVSPHLRTVLFATYSRHWKHDGNVYENREMVDIDQDRETVFALDASVQEMTRTTPFAVPDGYDTDIDPGLHLNKKQECKLTAGSIGALLN